MWTDLMTTLADAGYHCLAPDQRGYGPGARPTEVDAYRHEELAADVLAFGREVGGRFHLVGHDWGAIVGWLTLATDPSPVASFTAMSIPHYAQPEDGTLRSFGCWRASAQTKPIRLSARHPLSGSAAAPVLCRRRVCAGPGVVQAHRDHE
jgi:pimeloyl-ACP methyl ester carboxylesterase